MGYSLMSMKMYYKSNNSFMLKQTQSGQDMGAI